MLQFFNTLDEIKTEPGIILIAMSVGHAPYHCTTPQQDDLNICTAIFQSYFSCLKQASIPVIFHFF